jgi:PGF-CTERM protein
MARHTRFWLCLLLVVGALAAGTIAMPVAAEHGEEVDSLGIAEFQQISTTDTPEGTVKIKVSYALGEFLTRFQVDLRNATYRRVVDRDGFRTTGTDGVYEWDERTDRPSVTILRNVTTPDTANGSEDFMKTDSWTITERVYGIRPAGGSRNPGRVSFSFHTRTGDNGTSGEDIVYLGEYEKSEFAAGGEQFTVVVSNATVTEPVHEPVRESLKVATNRLHVGGRSPDVTAVIVPDPIRGGGLSSGPDFWTHEDDIRPDGTTVYHEYVHTRQAHITDESAEWTTEAEAEYYQHLLALQHGTLEYGDFRRTFEDYSSHHTDAVLTQPDTWSELESDKIQWTDYERGSVAIAALDARIREATDGQRSYQDVLEAKNSHEGEVTDADMERFASEAAGEDMSGFFKTHIRSGSETLSPPPITALDAPDTGADLAVSATDVEASAGDTATLELAVTNEGSGQSIAPAVQVGLPANVSQANPAFLGQGETVTDPKDATDEQFVLTHLGAGETARVEYELSTEDVAAANHTIDLTVRDLSGNGANTTAALAISDPASSGSGPGFGPVVALAALLVFAAIAGSRTVRT